MQKLQIARREAERELEVASVKLSVWKESAVSNLPSIQHLPSSQHLHPIQPLLPSQHLPPLEIVPTFLMTSPHEAKQSRAILKTVTSGEHVSNICVSTICNSVNMNNVKPSVASSTFALKPVTNSAKFNDIVNAPNVAEPHCSNIYASNKSKNEPVYSNLKEFFSSEFQGPYRSDSVFAQSAPRAIPCVDLPYLGTQHYSRPNIYPPGFAPPNYPTYDELFLPRPEFKRFNGNPLAYRAFISNFETHVEPRLNDQRMLFCLLLQHFKSNVRDKIEHFSEMGSMAYTLAKERLCQEQSRSTPTSGPPQSKRKSPCAQVISL